MAKQPNPLMKPIRWVLESDLIRNRYESYPLLTPLWELRWVNKPPPPLRAVVTKCSNLWPISEPLTYSFLILGNNKIQSNREKKVEYVIEHIQKMIPGIKFVAAEVANDAMIRIGFDHEHPDGTWCQVGMNALKVNFNEPTMNFSRITVSGEILEGSDEYGDIMHEFLHALGMLHEHQHPERKFALSERAVVKDLMADGLTEKAINDNTRKLSHEEVGPLSPPDDASNTIYDIDKSWTEDGSELKRNNKPSDVDWAWLNMMYPPPEQTQFEEALSKCGVDICEESRESILKLYSDGQWEKIRSQLTRITNPSSNLNQTLMGKVWGTLVRVVRYHLSVSNQ